MCAGDAGPPRRPLVLRTQTAISPLSPVSSFAAHPRSHCYRRLIRCNPCRALSVRLGHGSGQESHSRAPHRSATGDGRPRPHQCLHGASSRSRRVRGTAPVMGDTLRGRVTGPSVGGWPSRFTSWPRRTCRRRRSRGDCVPAASSGAMPGGTQRAGCTPAGRVTRRRRALSPWPYCTCSLTRGSRRPGPRRAFARCAGTRCQAGQRPSVD